MAKNKSSKGNRGGMGGFGGGMPGGMGGLMAQVTKMQEEMEKTQAELAEEELEVSAGGGMVTIVITGAKEVRSIKIKPEAVDPDDVEMLEDLVLAAVTEALQKADALAEERMGGVTGGLGLPPGFGF